MITFFKIVTVSFSVIYFFSVAYASDVQSTGLVMKYCGFINAINGKLSAHGRDYNILSTDAQYNGINASVTVVTNTPETFEIIVKAPANFSKMPELYRLSDFSPSFGSDFKVSKYFSSTGKYQGNEVDLQKGNGRVFLANTGKNIFTFNVRVDNHKDLMFLAGNYEITHILTCAVK